MSRLLESEDQYEFLNQILPNQISPPTGMDLNDMVTNRQRCLILGNNLLVQHQNQRIQSAAIAQPTRMRGFKCVHCTKYVQSGDTNYTKCRVEKCKRKYCMRLECQQTLTSHEQFVH